MNRALSPRLAAASIALLAASLLAPLAAACAPAVPPAGDAPDAGEGEGESGEGEGEGEGEGDGGEGEGEGGAGEGEGEGEGEGGEGEGEGGEGESELPAGYGPYDVAGPHAFDQLELDVDGAFDVDVYLPSGATAPGPRPVVSLSPGLQQPASAYTSYGERLASHGFLVVIRGDPGLLTQTPEVVEGIAHVVTTWLPAENADPESALFGRVDVSRVGLAGHSRGGKSSLLAAEHELSGLVRGWFGLDPVDSSTLAGGAFANQDLATLEIPTVFLFAEVESNCSPASTTEAAMWPVAPTPSVNITGIDAGHVQLEDPAGCIACAVCSPNGTQDVEVVLDYARRYLTAFMARELLDDDTVGAAFDGAGAQLDVDAGLITLRTR